MYYFIVNQNGGSGRAAKTWLKTRAFFKEAGVEFKAYETKSQGHATELARKITSKDEEDIRLIIVGGDGTINEVLNGIADFSKVKVGIVPTGSGNDFVRGHNLPTDTEEACKAILESTSVQNVDIGKITADGHEPRLFGISAGAGFDAYVCKKVDSSKSKSALNRVGAGQAVYLLATFETLFSMKKVDATMVMSETGDTRYQFKDLIFMAIMNLPCEGGGVKMAPEATPEDGLLDLCIASGIAKLPAFFKVPRLAAGKQNKMKGFAATLTEKSSLETKDPVVIHTDGEYYCDSTHVEFECLKGVMNLIR